MSDQLLTKMQQLEIPPPPGGWQKIAASLDEASLSESLAARFETYSVEPPSILWQHIETALKKEEKSKDPIALYPNWLRIAIAASVTGILIFSTWLFLPQNNHSAKIVDKEKKQQPNSKQNLQTPSSNIVASASTPQNIKYIVPKEHDPLVDSAEDDRTIGYTTINNTHDLPDTGTTPILPAPFQENYFATAQLSEYIIIPDNASNEGDVIKVSKKMEHAVPLISNVQYADNSSEYDKKMWKKRIKKWKKQLSNSGFTPSSVNFLDIMQIKELLNEN